MLGHRPLQDPPLRVFCVEDNPLIVCHLEMMIEDLGHVFAGSADSYADLQEQTDPSEVDCALVDIDLADGPTGPQAVAWLAANGIPSVLVTGQGLAAEQHRNSVVGIIGKPVTEACLATSLSSLAQALCEKGAVGSPLR